MLKYLVVLGAVVNFIGAFSYIKDTLYGNTKPNRVTWLMWSVTAFIGTVAALSNGVRWAVLPVFMSGFTPFLVFLASFVNKKPYWKLEKFDYFCGVFSMLALILWAITKQPIIAIIFAILSDFFAAVPTLVKSIKHPETESSIAYSTGVFNALTSFFAVTSWTFSSYGFPIYLVLMNGTIWLGGYWKGFRVKLRK